MKHILYTKLTNLRLKYTLEKDKEKSRELLRQIEKLERQIW